MPFNPVQHAPSGPWRALQALARDDGTAAHPFARKLRAADATLRDLSDAVHLISMLHGRYPGVVDRAAAHVDPAAAGEWLLHAAAAFAGERALLVRLVAAAGPLPSTPGQAESEAAVATQRHALDMLAQSDRHGCAAGAAMALVLDWHEVRGVLDAAATRLGIEVPPVTLPPADDTGRMAEAIAAQRSPERAMMFGAQQILAQHRGLWDLLDARASARERH